MAVLFHSSSSTIKTSRFETSIWVSKLVLIVVGTITTLLFFKVAILPYLFDVIVSTRQTLWISLHVWLSRPYIYLLLHLIILIIVASSSSQKPRLHAVHHDDEEKNKILDHVIDEEEEKTLDCGEMRESGGVINKENTAESKVALVYREMNEPVRLGALETCDEKSNRDRQDEDMSPGDKELEEEDGLEETWKMIMEKQGNTQPRQLNKCDTWNTPPRALEKGSQFGGGDGDDDNFAWAKRELKKSDTFNDTVSLRREKSMSPEELYRRAEELIKKFNYEMRMQRQESEQRFLDMVRRGL